MFSFCHDDCHFHDRSASLMVVQHHYLPSHYSSKDSIDRTHNQLRRLNESEYRSRDKGKTFIRRFYHSDRDKQRYWSGQEHRMNNENSNQSWLLNSLVDKNTENYFDAPDRQGKTMSRDWTHWLTLSFRTDNQQHCSHYLEHCNCMHSNWHI